MKIRRKIIEIDEGRCSGCGECATACAEGAIQIIDGKAKLIAEMYCDGLGACLGECPEGALTITERESDEFDPAAAAASALTHWPVQIRLIPPSAPFLQHADLLIAADCTPLAYAGFHRDLLPGKVVMLGCPKFDDVEDYVEKFTEIFRTAGITSITVVDMEVPCCSKLPMLVRKAVSLSGKAIPLEEVVISRKGAILQKRAVA
jgi:NAD-dependent dihydropyrimidine dehydrogenase PreA subunit